MNLLKIIGLTVFAITISLGTAYLIMYIQNKQGLFIDINGTILTFVGILATFIVVGNYAQVKSIEEKTNKAIENIETSKKELLSHFNESMGYSYEALFLSGHNSDYYTIFLFQACDNLLVALDNECEHKVLIDENIKQCIKLIKKNPIDVFQHPTHKSFALNLLVKLLQHNYEIYDLMDVVNNARCKYTDIKIDLDAKNP